MLISLIITLLATSAVTALHIPPSLDMERAVGVKTANETTCPRNLTPYCCYYLDYSGTQVECIGKSQPPPFFSSRKELTVVVVPGPGKVENLEKCRDYRPQPMCCCGYEKIPSMPWVGFPSSVRLELILTGLHRYPQRFRATSIVRCWTCPKTPTTPTTCRCQVLVCWLGERRNGGKLNLEIFGAKS